MSELTSDAEIEMIRRRLRSAEKDIESMRRCFIDWISSLMAENARRQNISGEAGVCATHILRDKELIERCAQVARDKLLSYGHIDLAEKVEAAIRALKDRP